MRVARLGIERFRAISQLTSPELAPEGLVVLWGLNEAGKSTLLRFVRELLFGFTKESAGSDGQRAAGWADLRLEDGSRLRWERRLSSRQRQGGEVQLVPAPAAAVTPASLLGNVSAQQFANVFAIGLDELERVKSAEAVSLGGQLYAAAGLGALALRLPEVERSLQQELAELIAPRSSKVRVNALLRELDDLAHRQRQCSDGVSQYDQKTSELNALAEQLRRLQQQEKELAEQLSRGEQRLQAFPSWEQLNQAYRQLHSWPDWPGYGPDSLARLAEREKAVAQAKQEVEEKARELEAVQAQIEQIQVDEGLLGRATLWRELEQERSRWQQLRQIWRDGQAELQSAEALIREEIAQLGPGWTVERITGVDTSVETLTAMEDWRRQYDQLEARRREQQRLVAAPELEPAVSAQQKAALVGRREALQRAAGLLRDLRSDLQQLSAGQAQLSGLQRSVRSSQETASYLQQNERMSRASAAASAAAGVGRGLVAFRRGLESGVAGLAGIALFRLAGLAWWVAGVLGALLGVATWLVLAGRQPGEQPQRSGRKGGGPTAEPVSPDPLAQLMVQLQQTAQHEQETAERLRQELARLGAVAQRRRTEVLAQLTHAFAGEQVTTPPGSLGGAEPAAGTGGQGEAGAAAAVGDAAAAAELGSDWANTLRLWMEWVGSWEARVVAALGQVERELARQQSQESQSLQARQLLATIEQQWQELQAEWGRWLGALGLPAEMKPSAVVELLRRVAQIRQRLAQRQQQRQEVERWGSELAHLVERFAAATQTAPASAAGLAEAEARGWAQLPEWLARVEAARQAQHRREQLQLALAAAQRAQAQAQQRWQRAELELAQLLEAGGTKSVDEFAQRAQEAEQHRQALVQAKRGAAALCAVMKWPAGLEQDIEAVVQRAQAELGTTSLAEIQDQVTQVKTARQRVQQEWDEVIRKHATLQRELQELAGSADLAELQWEQAQARTALHQAAAQAAVLQIAQGMLTQVRRRYEEERQPAVLRRAAQYLSRMTAQQYQRLIVPLAASADAKANGTNVELTVERANGQHLSPEQLSRGTAEQVYLSIRLALAEDFASRATPLPMLLDDVLVDFDPARLQGALAALAELSRQLQVLVFTCHPHVALAAAQAARQARTECQLLQLVETSRMTAIDPAGLERWATGGNRGWI